MNKKDLIREAAENSFIVFIRLVQANRELGAVHEELCAWITADGRKSHKLVLLPRDHQKSAIAAFYVAWRITKNPAIRVLYISSTSNLATKQLKSIKDILTSDVYRFYWPEMVNREESKREKWTETEISVDHPKRKTEVVRDPTVFTGGLTTSLTGLHCDLTVMDDVVVLENAYTEEGRERVALQYSLLASVESTDAEGLVVGTHYDPKDLYHDLKSKTLDIYGDEGEVIGSEDLYEVFERVVEDSPGRDGSGKYIWPRQQRKDGKWFGFSAEILAKKRSQYSDRTQFFAQYYNDPNRVGEGAIDPSHFQYYDCKFIVKRDGHWTFKGKRLNLFAAVDFAFSLKRRADYTAIAVIGVDSSQNYYILDLDRFKTDQIPVYFDHILRLHQKWDFRKLRAEVTAGQKPIVNSLKNDYIRVNGITLSVDDFAPTARDGNKGERIKAVLQTKYHNRQIWHAQDGMTPLLEEELVRSHPKHDDLKDAVASAVDVAIAPSNMIASQSNPTSLMTHSRFGGIL